MSYSIFNFFNLEDNWVLLHSVVERMLDDKKGKIIGTAFIVYIFCNGAPLVLLAETSSSSLFASVMIHKNKIHSICIMNWELKPVKDIYRSPQAAENVRQVI